MTSNVESESVERAREMRRVPQWVGPLVFTLLVLAVAAAFLIGSTALHGRPGRFPFVVAIITIAFGALELARQVLAIRSSEESTAVVPADPDASTLAEKAVVISWFVLTLAGVLLAGVLPASFVSGVVYYRWVDRRSMVAALVAGAVLTGALWIVFELLAGFTLYTGMLR